MTAGYFTVDPVMQRAYDMGAYSAALIGEAGYIGEHRAAQFISEMNIYFPQGTQVDPNASLFGQQGTTSNNTDGSNNSGQSNPQVQAFTQFLQALIDLINKMFSNQDTKTEDGINKTEDGDTEGTDTNTETETEAEKLEKAKQMGADVSDLHEATSKHWGTDEDKVREILFERGYTSEELVEIADMFEQRYGQSLEDAIKGDYSGEAEKIILAKLKGAREGAKENQDPTEKAKQMGADVSDLHEATSKHWGTDEDKVREILFERGYTSEELVEIADMFEQRYGQSLEDAIKGDYSGEAEKIILAELKGAREKTGKSEESEESK